MNSFFLKYRLTRIGRRVTADPNLKVSLRERLVQAGYLPEQASLWVRMRMVTASIGVLCMGFGGMASYAYASDAVLPDTPLYPVRQSIEALEVKLAPTPEVRAKVIEKQVERRQKEAHLLEKLHKPLPPLHASILKEEREERAALKAERTSSTRARHESFIRSRTLSIPDAQSKEVQKEYNQNDGKDDRTPKRMRALPFINASSTLPIQFAPVASSTRPAKGKLPILRREVRENRLELQRKNQKNPQNHEERLERSRRKEGV